MKHKFKSQWNQAPPSNSYRNVDPDKKLVGFYFIKEKLGHFKQI